FFVEAAEPHGGDRFGRDADRVHAALRRHTRVGGPAADEDLQMIRPRGPGERAADGVAVEDETASCAEEPGVQVTGAEEADLLADREDDVEGRMPDAALPAHAHALADDRHARFVVAAEDRRP